MRDKMQKRKQGNLVYATRSKWARYAQGTEDTEDSTQVLRWFNLFLIPEFNFCFAKYMLRREFILEKTFFEIKRETTEYIYFLERECEYFRQKN